MRLFATSDLHVDFRENFQVLQQLSNTEFTRDALLVAGDVAHRPDMVREGLSLLKGKFQEVFYVPGNHELWVWGEAGDSLSKFEQILEICAAIGVRTRPGRAGGRWIVPLFSWYDDEFDGRGDEKALEAWADFRYCRWPAQLGSCARYFSRLNEPHLEPRPEETVSFSHFLPRPELLPDPEYLRFKGLSRVAGSAHIERQIRALGARVHLFGHSHIRRDMVLDGVRYVQNALGYPRERRGREFELQRID